MHVQPNSGEDEKMKGVEKKRHMRCFLIMIFQKCKKKMGRYDTKWDGLGYCETALTMI